MSVHLSTLMCPKHRKEILRWIKAWLLGKKLVCCVSTALIEAGINVSFPIVVRSWAGIPSLIQAAGRCNRNCEEDTGRVYIWNLTEESLGPLPDIQKGKEFSMSLLRDVENPDELGNPEMIKNISPKRRYVQKRLKIIHIKSGTRIWLQCCQGIVNVGARPGICGRRTIRWLI